MDATGALLAGVNLLDVHAEPLLRRAHPRRGVAAAQGELDRARRLGRLRAVGRRLRGSGGRRGRVGGALHARPPDDRRGQPRPSRLRQPLRPLDVPGQQPGPEARRHHGVDAGAAGRRDREGRGRPPDRSPEGRGRGPRAQGDSPDRLRAAAGAGARGAARGARGRRDDDPGPVVRGAGDGLPGAPAEGRADGAHQHPPAALPGRGRRDARLLARLRRRLAAPGRLQGLGRRDHGQQRRPLLRAVPPRPEKPRQPAPRHVPRGPGRRGDDDDREGPLHALPAREPREADQGRGALGRAAARARHRRPRQPHPARRLREGPDRGGPARHGPPLAGDPRPARPSRRLRALRPAEAGRRGQPVPHLGRHALDGGAHRQRAGARRLRVPQAEGRRRRPRLRQRQPRHQRRPLLLEPGVRALRRRHPPDPEGRAQGRLVPRPAPDHRGGDRGLHQGSGLGVLRGGPEGNARARQAGRRRRLRHRPRGGGADEARRPAQGEGPLHHRRAARSCTSDSALLVPGGLPCPSNRL